MWVCSRLHHQQAIADKEIWAATVVAVLLLLLNILHCSGKAYNELQLCLWCHLGLHCQCIPPCWCSHPPRCATHAEGVTAGWLPLSFCRGKKPICLGFAGAGCGQVVGWFYCFLLLSLSCHLEIIRIHLLITACFEVCHHHFKLFSPPIETVPLPIQLCVPVVSVPGMKPWGLCGASTGTPPLCHSLLLTHLQLEELLIQGI